MHRPTIKTSIVMFLIFSLTFIQITPGIADAKKVQVAFVGIQFEYLPTDIQKAILERVTNLFTAESSLQLVKPADVQEKLGSKRVKEFLNQLDQASFSEIADELKVDHVFAGRLINNSRESERILLAGELYRFDRASNLKHKFEVLKYYENFGVELTKFKYEFVKTITTDEGTGRTIVPLMALAGIALVGVAIFVLVKMDVIGSGGDPGDDPVEPH